MLGYMDCHQEAIDFLTQEANLPADHPIIKQLNTHLLKQQQNLDLVAMERNLQFAQELRNVAEMNSSPNFDSQLQIAESSVEQVKTEPIMSLSTITSSTPENTPEAKMISLANNYPTTRNGTNKSVQFGPVAETYLSSCHLTNGVVSATVQTTPKIRQKPKIPTPEMLPSFPIFAMPYLSPSQMITAEHNNSIYSVN